MIKTWSQNVRCDVGGVAVNLQAISSFVKEAHIEATVNELKTLVNSSPSFRDRSKINELFVKKLSFLTSSPHYLLPKKWTAENVEITESELERIKNEGIPGSEYCRCLSGALKNLAALIKAQNDLEWNKGMKSLKGFFSSSDDMSSEVQSTKPVKKQIVVKADVPINRQALQTYLKEGVAFKRFTLVESVSEALDPVKVESISNISTVLGCEDTAPLLVHYKNQRVRQYLSSNYIKLTQDPLFYAEDETEIESLQHGFLVLNALWHQGRSLRQLAATTINVEIFTGANYYV